MLDTTWHEVSDILQVSRVGIIEREEGDGVGDDNSLSPFDTHS